MQGMDQLLRQVRLVGALGVIKGIKFTPREIDIISGLMHMRGPHKIASLLDISPNTVVSHLRNIRLKIGSGSLEGIIDFVESSPVLPLFKEYYSHIGLNATFESSLKAIGKENSKTHDARKKIVLIIWGNNPTQQKFLQLQLRKHLRYVKLSVETKVVHTNEDIAMPKEEEHILLLCLEESMHERMPELHPKIETIYFLDHQNYYFFVFELLKKLLYPMSLDKHYRYFSEQFQKAKDSSHAALCPFQEQAVEKNAVNSLQRHVSFQHKKLCFVFLVVVVALWIHSTYFIQKKYFPQGEKIQFEFAIPIQIFLNSLPPPKQESKDNPFAITAITVHLDAGEHGGATIESIKLKKETPRGAKARVAPK
jgi:DNA-binding CsgD family transcriptional regulator